MTAFSEADRRKILESLTQVTGLDSLNKAYRDKGSILDQKYEKQILSDLFMKIFNLKND